MLRNAEVHVRVASAVFLGICVVFARKHEGASQFQANCPPSCQCNKTTVICDNGDMKNTEVFLAISDLFYPDLETLAIRGNKFGELEPRNLFGPNITHHRLSRVVLSNNDISMIHAEAFSAIPKVEELDLSMNNVSSVHGDLFKNMDRLKSLELIKFFDEKVSVKHRANLLYQMFVESRSEFIELRRLVLDMNALVYLPKDMFCKLPGLEILSLKNNFLPAFTVDSKCLPGLRTLDLSKNEIDFVAADATDRLENVPHLETVNFSGNPFKCNCYLKDFIVWFQTSERVRDARNDVFCEQADPAEYAMTDLSEVKAELLKCPEGGKDYLHTVYIFVALALIGLCLLLACLIYNNRSL